MCNKSMYSFIKELFEKEGYTLLSAGYINAKTKLRYLCNHNKLKYITWAHFKEGRRCNCDAKNKKPTYQSVKLSFEKNGYRLLTVDYKNNSTKLYYVCSNGHKHSIIWSNWCRGHRCPTCAGQTKPTIEEVEESFISEEYVLLSTEYNNSHSHLDYICSEGHKHRMMWTNWQSGYRCPTCYSIYNNGSNSTNWRGGISFETYCAVWQDKEYKQDIRDRDGNKCLNPYCNSPNKKDLTIHHIDYDKHNCHFNNLITVCRSCNSRANYNRKWHKSWYQALLYRRYGYNHLKEVKNV